MYNAKYGLEDFSEGDQDEDIAEAIAVSNAKYPQIVVRLVGEDGNSFAIMGRVAKALKRGGVKQPEVNEFYAECQASHNQTALLIVVMKWVTAL